MSHKHNMASCLKTHIIWWRKQVRDPLVTQVNMLYFFAPSSLVLRGDRETLRLAHKGPSCVGTVFCIHRGTKLYQYTLYRCPAHSGFLTYLKWVKFNLSKTGQRGLILNWPTSNPVWAHQLNWKRIPSLECYMVAFFCQVAWESFKREWENKSHGKK